MLERLGHPRAHPDNELLSGANCHHVAIEDNPHLDPNGDDMAERTPADDERVYMIMGEDAADDMHLVGTNDRARRLVILPRNVRLGVGSGHCAGARVCYRC